MMTTEAILVVAVLILIGAWLTASARPHPIEFKIVFESIGHMDIQVDAVRLKLRDGTIMVLIMRCPIDKMHRGIVLERALIPFDDDGDRSIRLSLGNTVLGPILTLILAIDSEDNVIGTISTNGQQQRVDQ